MPRLFSVSTDFIGLAWQLLAVGLAICLGCSALGFKRVEYFVSLGYAASIARPALHLTSDRL